MRHRLRASIVAILVIAFSAGLAGFAAGPASTTATAVEQVTFETRADGVTVVIRTGRPVPAYSLSLGASDNHEVTLTVQGPLAGVPREYTSPSPFLESVTLASVESPNPSFTLKIRPRRASVVGVDQRDDGVAVRLAAFGVGDAPGDSDYRVGIGDKIEIGVFGHDDMNRVSEVKTDGTVAIPLLGDVKVAGRSVAEIDRDVTQRLAQEYLVDPEVNVDVREYKSQWVTLMGEVRTPGRYALRSNMRLIDLLAEAGGPTKDAGTDIVLTRHDDSGQGTHQTTVHLDDILNPGKPESNIALRHGDIVTLGQRDWLYLRGEVSRPGAYNIERGWTILRAISAAGGLTQFANRKEVQLLRAGTGAIQEKTVVNLKAIEDGHKEDIPLLPNDIIIVPRRIF
jgi:polysaccharide biosynthesis/export protein